ncbi:hypothetical protein RN001_003292 [Aquatica leii]|uniref:Uncharacterized protein n=1 Tax=Aquatica leii TaxID=1421715 RepID=A0AAN7PNH0_9COLE|nr:hypothetical protein RN001_003292 [Aquatica leii]
MVNMLKLFCAIILIHKSNQQDISAIADLKTLSEFPLDKLLKLKNDFNVDSGFIDNEVSDEVTTETNLPKALALQSKPNLLDRGGYELYHDKKGHKKDASTIFQISVTTLSFVAFGGYLLCLIIQAIRAKHATSTTTPTPASALLLRPINYLHRNSNLQQNHSIKNSKPSKARYRREISSNLDSEVRTTSAGFDNIRSLLVAVTRVHHNQRLPAIKCLNHLIYGLNLLRRFPQVE